MSVSTDTAATPSPIAPSPIAPWRRRQRLWPVMLLGGVVVFVLAQTLGFVVWSALAAAGGQDVEGAVDAMLADPSGWRKLAAFLTQAVVALAGTVGVVRLVERRRAGEFGLGAGRVRELALGLLLGLALMSALIGILALAGAYTVDSVGWSSGILVGIGLGVGAGIAEEVFFRGVLLRVVEGVAGTVVALVFTAVLFGVVHLTNEGATVWTAIAIAIEAGILLAACWILTQNVWLAVGVHVAWNAAQSAIFGTTVSGLATGRGLIEPELSGPTWLTGGSAGPEGSVVAVLLCLVVAVPMLVVAHRRGRFVPLRGLRADAGAGRPRT